MTSRIRFTDKQRTEFKEKRIEERSKLSLAFQLGYYVGEQIVNRYLPTLSCDMLQTRIVIEITPEEEAECKRLNAVWFGKRMSLKSDADHKESETEWNELRAYHEMLESKYLQDTIDCRFQLLNIEEKDIVEFKKGLGISLWDCDCSHYNTNAKDIQIKIDEDAFFTIITLNRSKE